MPVKAKELGALAIQKLPIGRHAVGGVSGLILNVRCESSKYWFLRVRTNGKRREFGIGAYSRSGIGLKEARERALELLSKLAKGVDPVLERSALKARIRAESAKSLTFAEAAEKYVSIHEPSWKSIKHARQWRATLETYANPVLGILAVSDIETAHVVAVLQPIWTVKTETASRLRGRIEAVLDWCKFSGFRTGENPARWAGHLEHSLSSKSKTRTAVHHKAMPYIELGGFIRELRAMQSMGAAALEFVILTAARSGEVRGARWSEFDLIAKTWTIPKERMKAGKEHRVSLSNQAMALLKSTPRVDDSNLVFWSSRTNVQLSDMTLTKVIRDKSLDYVPHGFRATFKTWAKERTSHSTAVIEMALAHQEGDKVAQAYDRTDLLARRVRLMQDWADYIDHQVLPNVIPFFGGLSVTQT
jgi:integrase